MMIMKHFAATAALLASLANVATPVHADDQLLARTAATVVLPGSGHSWGFAALDPARPLLWLARRENGLTLFDVERQQAVRTLPDSAGANAVLLVPKADRAYVSNMDGTLTVLRLSDQAQLQRLHVSDANLNSAVYEPVSGRVLIASGRRAGKSTIYALDPALDRIVAQQDLDIKKIDPPLVLGDGSVLLPMRDEGQVMRLAGASLQVLGTWRLAGCAHPSALAADLVRQRLFAACRGASPVLVVADLKDGAVKATLPVGRNVNALAYDAARRRIVAPSGTDGNISFYQQDDADHYRALGQVATRTWAHNMVYDSVRSRAYLFTMDVTQPDGGPQHEKREPLFHADSFTVLTLQLE